MGKQAKVAPATNGLKRAVLYARVSGDDRGRDGRNLAGQIKMCREYALAHHLHVVAELAEDDRGASGASFELPQLNQVYELARVKEFDVLVVREIDRLSRSLAKQLIVEEELKRCGVQIEYVLGEYPDTPEGNLMKNVKASVAEYERLKIAERMTRGRRLYVQAGGVLLHGDRPPYGYRLSKDGKTLVIHEEEARIVRLIFTWYAEGDENGKKLGSKLIARKLSQMRVPTWQDVHGRLSKKRKHGEWADATITLILSNETYIGLWHYGKHKSPRERNPRSQWITVNVPAIISRELWDKAQAQKALNKAKARRNVKYDYLLRGCVTCGQCGSRVYAKSVWGAKCGRKTYFYYGCNTVVGRVVGRHCGSPYFPAHAVDGLVWNWVKSLLSEPATLAEGLSAYQAEQDRLNEPLRDRLEVVDQIITTNRKQLDRLLELYLSGDFDKEMLLERKHTLETTLAGLERERTELEAHLSAHSLTQEQVQQLQDVARRVAKGLEAADDDFQTRLAIIETLDVRATLAVENGERVVYVRGILGDEALSITSNTPSGSNHNRRKKGLSNRNNTTDS